MEPPSNVVPLPEGSKVYIGDDVKTIEEEHKNKIQLPPNPQPIIDWTEEEQKQFLYTSQDVYPMDDIQKRLQFKMFNIWNMWGAFRNNEKLIDIVNQIPEDKETDDFFIKQAIVIFIDRLGKILNGGTNLVEEILTTSSPQPQPEPIEKPEPSLKQREQINDYRGSSSSYHQGDPNYD